MASVTRVDGTKGARWRAQIRRKGYPQQSAYFTRKSDADRWAREIEAKIDLGKVVFDGEARKRTLSQLISRYSVEILPQKKSARDQAQQLSVWDGLIGDKALFQITADVLLKARAEIAKRITRHDTTVSNATVNRYMAALDHVLQTAEMQYGWIERNPMRRLKKLKEPQGRVRTLTDHERARLLKACRDSRSPFLETIFLMALTTGMRKNEIMNLTWDSVHFASGIAVVEDPKNGERRSVSLMPEIVKRLRDLCEVRQDQSIFLFPGKSGTTPIDIKKSWYSALQASGVENFRFHDLRHTAATMVAMNGGTIPQIAAILGHKSHQMASRYAHLTHDNTRSLLEETMSAVFDDD